MVPYRMLLTLRLVLFDHFRIILISSSFLVSCRRDGV